MLDDTLKILVDISQIEEMLLQAQKEAYRRFKEDEGLSREYWTSKAEIKSYFKWGDTRLSEEIAKGLPYIQLSDKTFLFYKKSVNEFLLKQQMTKR